MRLRAEPRIEPMTVADLPTPFGVAHITVITAVEELRNVSAAKRKSLVIAQTSVGMGQHRFSGTLPHKTSRGFCRIKLGTNNQKVKRASYETTIF